MGGVAVVVWIAPVPLRTFWHEGQRVVLEVADCPGRSHQVGGPSRDPRHAYVILEAADCPSCVDRFEGQELDHVRTYSVLEAFAAHSGYQSLGNLEAARGRQDLVLVGLELPSLALSTEASGFFVHQNLPRTPLPYSLVSNYFSSRLVDLFEVELGTARSLASRARVEKLCAETSH